MKKNGLVFPTLLLITILILFALLHPKLSTTLFSGKRLAVWDQFIADVRVTQQINHRAFWKMREFYAPGYFSVDDKQGLPNDDIVPLFAAVPTATVPGQFFYPYAVHHSTHTPGAEILVETATLSAILNIPSYPKSSIILDTNNTFVAAGSQKAVIMFIQPLQEALHANGFFTYEKKQLPPRFENMYSLTVQLVYF